METLLVLIYTTGSLPPAYAYSYTINFYKDATASIRIFKGYEETPTYSDKNTYDLKQLKEEMKKLSDMPEREISRSSVGGERREIIYMDQGRTARIIISPDDTNAIRTFERLLLLYDEDFHILISNQTQDT